MSASARAVDAAIERILADHDRRGDSNAEATLRKMTVIDIRSAIRAAGFVIVPREPTEEMKQAWTNAAPPRKPELMARYRAMLSAAEGKK